MALGLTFGGSAGSSKTVASVANGAPNTLRPRRRQRREVQRRGENELERLIRIGLPVYCGGQYGHDVALTFDDGPGPYTSLAIKILHRAHAQATFFLVGRLLAGWPRLPRTEETVAVLGDHTWTHPPLPRLSLRAMDAELARTQAAVAHAGGRPVQLFRPPYGATDAAIGSEARRLAMLEVLWSVDSTDSAPGATYLRIETRVLQQIRPGSIVLMHENRGQTIRALKFYILPALRRLGLRPVTLPQLLTADPPTPRQLEAGWRGCFSKHGVRVRSRTPSSRQPAAGH